MAWLIFALGIVLAIAGAAAVAFGAEYVEIERGWTEVIAGSVVLSGGIMTIALGCIVARLDGLRRDLAHARVSPEFETPPATQPALSAETLEPAVPQRQLDVARDAFEPLVDAAVAPEPIVAAVPRAAPVEPKPPEAMPARAPLLAGAMTLAGAAGGGDEAPVAEAIPASYAEAPTAPAEASPARVYAPSMHDETPLADVEAQAAQVAEPAAEVDEPAAHVEEPAAYVEEPAGRVTEEHHAGAPAVPVETLAVPVETQVAHAEAPPEPARALAFSAYVLRDAEAPRPSSAAPEVHVPADDDPTSADWLDRELTKLDQSFQAHAMGDRPPAPPREIEIGRASDQPAADVEPAAPRKAALVGRYSAGGVSYAMFDDGSIEADTPNGTFSFASIDELKIFIEESTLG